MKLPSRSVYSQSFSFFILCVLIVIFTSGCGSTQQTTGSESPEPEPPTQQKPEEQPSPEFEEPVDSTAIIDPENIPETPREMRAAWVASVANIDWPTEPGLPVARQKAELRAIMDRAALLNMNAIILQVRPSADALYDSQYEPWSEFLTGKQGQAPDPFYDPLKFAVDEAHKRGLELHAWFNPFRAYHYTAESELAENHIKNRRPQLVKEYGRYLWLDPGRKEARDYTLQVILDVARRYDIDGVHLDDYFYPYAEVNASGADIPFPDSESYDAYINENGSISKGDWRRQNINRFVQRLNKNLKDIDPHLQFGISPFGIWRPGHPPQIEGFDAYANLYADARKWFNEGWVDYLSPQLYWSIDKPEQSFPALLDWWHRQNTFDRHLWPGLYTNRIPGEWDAEEIRRQIRLIRKQPGATGAFHFSMKTLMENASNISGELLMDEYAQPALVPASPWISTKRPPQPEATLQKIGNRMVISLPANQEQQPWLWILKTRYGDQWQIEILPGWTQSRALPAQNENGVFKGAVISTVNETGNESISQMLLPVLERVEETE